MAHWVKPSGVKIETNDMDVTIEYCESLGWKRNEEVATHDGDGNRIEPGDTDEVAGEDTTETGEE